MRLTRTHQGRNANAAGVVTPLARVIGHIGWVAGILDHKTEEQYTAEVQAEVFSELRDALEHMGTDREQLGRGFVSDTTITGMRNIRTALNNMAGDVTSLPDTINNAKVILHDATGVMALYERDTSGFEADPGTRV